MYMHAQSMQKHDTQLNTVHTSIITMAMHVHNMKQHSTSYVDKDVIQYSGRRSFWVYTDDYLPIVPKSYQKETLCHYYNE